MRLRFKFKAAEQAQTLFTSSKTTPVVGDVIKVYDKATWSGNKPTLVRVVEIVTHIKGGDIFIIEYLV